MLTQTKLIRSFLFVPGNKPTWIEKSVESGADALILDLEDSVPPAQKVEAREIVRSKLAWLAEQKQRVWVRINRSAHLYDFDDILAIVNPALEGVVISKPCGPEDIHTVSSMLAEAEYRAGVPVGHTRVIPLLETARSLQLAYEIAQHERVPAIVGATAKNADVAHALKTVWSLEGRETQYLKSRVVMAARAAGKLPIGGVWQQVRDLDGLRVSSANDRQLGMSGELVLHPSNVEIVNRTYSPTEEEVAFYQGMIDALDHAQAEGRASCIYDGEHIDIAHAKTAREIIALAESFNR
ncbi:citryl-CoA lyase [Burkholderia lata]|uniref:HpcH/HpaI aldolase/citrate lyase family protein n=1 Tax=Burkholderia lata (strain ATCC 17760 / DSM 23089 / LMG 22485 / NCIMB 9086 / R18194 / 383) TaxID=482957 RepID=UPI00145393DD|nr:CoA ester lyase [Burkholderia lata]VWC58078.1 citryl-CoA lyase [Burkholderia lata]